MAFLLENVSKTSQTSSFSKDAFGTMDIAGATLKYM